MSLVSRADAARFQRFLHERQFPADCGATVGARTRRDYFYALGLGAQMVSLKFNLVHALLSGRVYHFPSSHYVNPLRCPSRSFDCYFAKPTNCSWDAASPAAHNLTEEVKIHWCFDLPRRRLTRLAGLRSVHAKEWYHAQIAAFLFRPNAETAAFGRALIADMEGAAPGAAPLALPGRAGSSWQLSGRRRSGRQLSVRGNGSCVAMHIRRTDKHTEDHRTAQRSFSDFAQLFKSWGYWRYDGAVGSLRAFIGSEDQETFTAMPPLLAPYGSYWIPASHFVMDGSNGKRFVDIRQGNSRLGELYGGLEDAAKGKSGMAAALKKDEGLVLVAQVCAIGSIETLTCSHTSLTCTSLCLCASASRFCSCLAARR